MEKKTCASVLKEEFERRKQEYPRFSLRAFARLLGISPASLSQVMSGSRCLGVRSAVLVADQCGFPPEKRAEFISLAIGTPVTEVSTKTIDSDFRLLEVTEFERIATWRHYAILSLGDLPQAPFDKHWVANRLNISEADAEVAMFDLRAMNLIEVDGDHFRQTGRPLRTRTDVPCETIQKFHSQLMLKAGESLATVDVRERDVTAVTMAVNKGRLRAAKKRIKEFRRNIMDFLSEGPKDEVYALQISLFPLSRNKSN